MTFRAKDQVDLSSANTLALPCRAVRVVEVFNESDLLQAVNNLSLTAQNTLVLGSASNVLLPEHLSLTVLKLKNDSVEIVAQDAASVTLVVGAGMIWDELVAHCVAQNWYGLENLSLIPGTVGAAPVQNIGAYGVELADVLVSVRAFDFQSGEFINLSLPECQFGYRDSLFKREAGRFVITQVLLRLSKQPAFKLIYGDLRTRLGERENPTLADVRAAICAVRSAKLPDPAVLPNVGSFFKNPVVDAEKCTQLRGEFPGLVAYSQSGGHYKLAAGWLIEQTGWKGRDLGPVGMHQQQALVLVNRGGATRQDVQALSRAVRESVLLKFGVELEQEPVWIAG